MPLQVPATDTLDGPVESPLPPHEAIKQDDNSAIATRTILILTTSPLGVVLHNASRRKSSHGTDAVVSGNLLFIW